MQTLRRLSVALGIRLSAFGARRSAFGFRLSVFGSRFSVFAFRFSRAIRYRQPSKKLHNYSITQLLNSYVASTAGNSSAASRPRTFALVTSTTAATIITVPPTMYRFTLSCSTSQPRNTAITGFT